MPATVSSWSPSRWARSSSGGPTTLLFPSSPHGAVVDELGPQERQRVQAEHAAGRGQAPLAGGREDELPVQAQHHAGVRAGPGEVDAAGIPGWAPQQATGEQQGKCLVAPFGRRRV